ncbi:hypothetical protein ACQ5SP_11375 [Rhodovulum sp. YNF3179]|uniref:hypothetical protein n=1 Tax=Rhodovulum sp. YNF3179 TaxID=3425127 RepID=UPI003D345CE4
MNEVAKQGRGSPRRKPGDEVRPTEIGLPVKVVALLPIGFLTAVVLFILDFFLFALNANFFINFMILLVLGFGVVAGVLSAFHIDEEYAALRMLKRQIDSGDLRVEALPEETHLAMAVSKMLGETQALSTRVIRDTVRAEMDIIRAWFRQRLVFLQYLTGLLVSLGLLGTFIGLLRTLVSAGEILEQVGGGTGRESAEELNAAFNDMVLSLQEPLSAMGTAFSSSMFGLVGSMTTGIMGLILARAAERYFELSRRSLTDVLREKALDPALESFDSDSIAEFISLVAAREQEAGTRMDKLVNLVGQTDAAVRRLALSNQEAIEGMHRFVKSAEALPDTLNVIRNLPGALDQTRSQLAALDLSMRSQAQSSQALLTGFQSESVARNRMLHALHDAVDDQKSVNKTLVEAYRTNAKAEESRAAMVRDSAERMQAGLHATGTSLATISEKLDALTRLAEIQQDLANLQSTMESAGQRQDALVKGQQRYEGRLTALIGRSKALGEHLARLSEQASERRRELSSLVDINRMILENEGRRDEIVQLIRSQFETLRDQIAATARETRDDAAEKDRLQERISDVLVSLENTAQSIRTASEGRRPDSWTRPD